MKKLLGWNKLKRLLAPMKKDPRLFVRGFAINSVRNIYAIYIIQTIKRLTAMVEAGNFDRLLYLVIEFGVSVVLYHIFTRACRHRRRGEMNDGTTKVVEDDIMEEYFLLDNNAVEQIGSGRLVSIILRGIENWKDSLRIINGIVPTAILTIAYMFWIIFSVMGWLGLIFLLATLVIYIFVLITNKKAMFRRGKRKDEITMHDRRLVKMIMNKFEILQNKKSNTEIKKLLSYTNKAQYLNKKLNSRVWVMVNIPRFMHKVFLFLVFLYVLIAVKNGNFLFANLTVLIATAELMRGNLLKTVEKFKELTDRFIHIEKLWNLLDHTPHLKKYNSGKKFEYQGKNIQIEKIKFAYEHEIVFDDFNLEIQANKKTALVGPSGGGKSTLIKLISGFIRPDKGNIFVDGQNLKEIKLADYYKHIGYLTQDPSIFDGTIMENLTYALNKNLDPKELEKVVKAAKCEFIYKFKNGFDTEIGERGIRLSGGQKQRLAIAKIMLKKPEIILLDEPTSALDSVSEQKISEALHNLFKGKTVIIVAHRLQTVKEADEIIVIDQGKILERGSHLSLSKKSGLYKKMLDLQTSF